MLADAIPWKVVFMGCPDFAIQSLGEIFQDPLFLISAVFTMPDKPKGRGNKMGMTPIKTFALEKNLPIFEPESFRKSPAAIDMLRSIKPEFIVAVAYGLILPQEVLDIPTLAPVNLHASLLPKYRGPSPIHFALANGEKETGNTIIRMNSKMDEGDILAQETLQINDLDTLSTLHDRLSRDGAKLLLKTLKSLARGEIQAIPQDHSQATYTQKISTEMARIDWERKSSELLQLFRAMSPCPGVWFELDGERIKVGKMALGGTLSGVPGSVRSHNSEDGIHVVCGEKTSIHLLSLQRPGKAMMSAGDFLRGYKKPLISVN